MEYIYMYKDKTDKMSPDLIATPLEHKKETIFLSFYCL